MNVYTNAIRYYGPNMQKTVCMEELAELIQAISKELRNEDIGNIPEEIADVQIMIEQMMIIYDCRKEVAKKKAEKLARLKRWIEA